MNQNLYTSEFTNKYPAGHDLPVMARLLNRLGDNSFLFPQSSQRLPKHYYHVDAKTFMCSSGLGVV